MLQCHRHYYYYYYYYYYYERALRSVLLTKYHSGDEVKKTEMGRTCGTYGGEERSILSLVKKTKGTKA
jgi:hypothetical protein